MYGVAHLRHSMRIIGGQVDEFQSIVCRDAQNSIPVEINIYARSRLPAGIAPSDLPPFTCAPVSSFPQAHDPLPVLRVP